MAGKRKPLSKRTRFEVFKRDSFTCQYCGSHPPEAVLHVDHIVPVAEGGQNDMDNLVTACDHCNLGKGAVSLQSVPASLSARAAEVAEREEQVRGYAEVMAAKRERIHEQAWDIADIFVEQFRLDGIRKDWLQSIKQFVEKIGVAECIRAMEIATARKPYSRQQCFSYFCGICWNIVREGGSL
ncbi:HNH endonuclease [Frateuria terrea]|uniref:HNH endonuclease n=1 Tax=Frateuria terrea TaxID=529704 RepID=A0A1H6ZSV9_9GAMM|nr:HNH endonuclease signature motif containing protein [Frateuria terrea]SEJ55274.1 HNH endonuclease [Frateuria terrea]SFP47292.1 HNH endonuclease [Frateuria terrea]